MDVVAVVWLLDKDVTLTHSVDGSTLNELMQMSRYPRWRIISGEILNVSVVSVFFHNVL